VYWPIVDGGVTVRPNVGARIGAPGSGSHARHGRLGGRPDDLPLGVQPAVADRPVGSAEVEAGAVVGDPNGEHRRLPGDHRRGRVVGAQRRIEIDRHLRHVVMDDEQRSVARRAVVVAVELGDPVGVGLGRHLEQDPEIRLPVLGAPRVPRLDEGVDVDVHVAARGHASRGDRARVVRAARVELVPGGRLAPALVDEIGVDRLVLRPAEQRRHVHPQVRVVDHRAVGQRDAGEV